MGQAFASTGGLPVEDDLFGEEEFSAGTLASLARGLPAVDASMPVGRFLEHLQGAAGRWRVFPVLEAGRPVGLVDRLRFLELMSGPYARDLFARHPLREFVRDDVPCFDSGTRLEAVVRSLAGAGDPSLCSHGGDCLLVLREGRYEGVVFVLDLLGRLTEVQMELARAANPLTGLPGNGPIERRIGKLLERGIPFQLGYCDLDHFKSFNDRYGHARGDSMILQLAAALRSLLLGEDGRAGNQGFVGHVGGDDFVVLVPDPPPADLWERILADFARRVPALYDPEDQAAGGFAGRDRRGADVFHPLVTLSIGVLPCPAGRFGLPLEVATAAAEVKHLAKSVPGNSWFLERRRA